MKLLTLTISELKGYLQEFKGPELHDFLLTFKVSKNESIQTFFCKQAIMRDEEDALRTFVVLDLENDNSIVGFFSLTITNRIFSDGVSKNQMKRISSKAAKDRMFTSILISKLGRSDFYKGKISGEEIMRIALDKSYEIYLNSGLKHVCVDYYDNRQLEMFYLEECSFLKYQYDQESRMNYCFYKFT
ncbi:hypothetical protein ACFQOY_03395 [Enterococcus alcedinis]|uniref:Uncharacterized protein n=1 Tax=Enterococcus alcedinis TaxID=1274384 RepID=A0A917N6X3_9ENTE|nr:hypothetical protein [Enterococcus alcedinis]MBP2102731.1 hypothetical protein [Enterococcus alcedinis]GGI66292.1 hypothetical protein GCM10011482_19460 [Enterococcus alcedinis]